MEDLTGTTVLIVDDEPDARELVQQVLGERGARVDAASGVEEALAWLQQEVPDVLISDIGMPVFDGFDLIRRVRSSPDRSIAAVKAVALTALTRAEDESRALRDGFDAFVAKPAEASRLVSEVARFRAALRAGRAGFQNVD